MLGCLDEPRHFRQIGTRFFHPDDVLMFGKLHYQFDRKIIPGKNRHVIEDHWKRRAIRDRAEKRQHDLRFQARLIKERSPHQRCVVTLRGRVFAHLYRLDDRIRPDTRDQNLLRTGELRRHAQNISALLV